VYSDFLASAMASYRTGPDHDHVSAFLLALAALERPARIVRALRICSLLSLPTTEP
jgi:hypothetical protein